MSYEIVKGLKIDTKKKEVWFKSTSNNVFPKNYYWFEAKTLSKMLKEDGKKKVEKIILEEYWKGNFQPGTENKYSKTVKFWKWKLPYTWDNTGNREENTYTNEELRNVLYEKLQEYLKRDKTNKWIIEKPEKRYVYGKTKNSTKIIMNREKAKKFNSYEDACVYAYSVLLDDKNVKKF